MHCPFRCVFCIPPTFQILPCTPNTGKWLSYFENAHKNFRFQNIKLLLKLAWKWTTNFWPRLNPSKRISFTENIVPGFQNFPSSTFNYTKYQNMFVSIFSGLFWIFKFAYLCEQPITMARIYNYLKYEFFVARRKIFLILHESILARLEEAF